MRKATLCLLVVAGLCLPSSAFGYVYLNGGNACSPGEHLSWPQQDLPLSYVIHQDGSDNMTMSALRTSIEKSFDAWSSPCCSSFAATYDGQTSSQIPRTQTQQPSNKIILEWEENNWPSALGSASQTIAVTRTQYNYQCELIDAPILFNGVHFDFSNNPTGRKVDLQGVATHEIGHLLGLDHSNDQTATMYASYASGTTSIRTLSQDDTQGVCSLYHRSCSCSVDSDCFADEHCVSGQCETKPCQSDADCEGGKVCESNGDCKVPTCNSDLECGDGFICNSEGTCVTDCPVCRTCQRQSDCGSDGQCVQLAGNPVCVVPCGTNDSCPGDSECLPFQDPNGGRVDLCVNPDSGSEGYCPSDYVCMAKENDGGASDAGPTDAGVPDSGPTDTGSGDDVHDPLDGGVQEPDSTSSDDVADTGPQDPNGDEDAYTSDAGESQSDDEDDTRDDNSDDEKGGTLTVAEDTSHGTESSGCSTAGPGSRPSGDVALFVALLAGAGVMRRRVKPE